MSDRLARWGLPLVPVCVGGGLWVLAHTGVIGDSRVSVALSALLGDWLLAIGVVIGLVTGGLVAVAARAQKRSGHRLQEQAAAAARDRRLLLSRLDHELKNPLTAMRAAVANVSVSGPGADRDAGLRSIDEQVLRLSRLTADLRKIADVEFHGMDRLPVDLTALLEEAVEVVREQPAAAGRELSLDLPRAPWPLPQVTGDWDLLSLAVVNLLDNAVKYTPPGGAIEVRARELSGHILIEVADTGPGIAPEDLRQIWDELFRSSSARSVPGSGLGLPLVRAVVERHGGTVGAESRLGRGTAVRIELPIAVTTS